MTDPSVAFDAQGNVYVLTLQTAGATATTSPNGAVYLTEFNFSGSTPTEVTLPNNGIVYQWLTGSDAATSPVIAADTSNNPTADPYANNVYIAWASIDTAPADIAARPLVPLRISTRTGPSWSSGLPLPVRPGTKNRWLSAA